MPAIKNHYVRNLVSALIVIVSIYLLGILFWKEIALVIQKIPIINNIYILIMKELANKSVLGLSLITFFGSLFLIGYPAELLFIVYSKVGYSMLYVSAIMIIFSMLGQAVNYGIGFFIEKKFLEKYIKHSKKEYLSSLKKYDAMFIVIINLLPLPSDILTLLLGMIKYDFRKTMLFTLIGRVLKFLFMIILVLIMRANGFLL
jgi:membrane protein YqaA with SNARE-associated domain